MLFVLIGVAISSAWFYYQRPLHQDHLDLHAQQIGEELLITWNRNTIARVHSAMLEICDGVECKPFAVSPRTGSMTYSPTGEKGEIRLRVPGTSTAETVLYLGTRQLPSSPEVQSLAQSFEHDLADVNLLLASTRKGTAQVNLLQVRANQALRLLSARSVDAEPNHR